MLESWKEAWAWLIVRSSSPCCDGKSLCFGVITSPEKRRMLLGGRWWLVSSSISNPLSIALRPVRVQDERSSPEWCLYVHDGNDVAGAVGAGGRGTLDDCGVPWRSIEVRASSLDEVSRAREKKAKRKPQCSSSRRGSFLADSSFDPSPFWACVQGVATNHVSGTSLSPLHSSTPKVSFFLSISLSFSLPLSHTDSFSFPMAYTFFVTLRLLRLFSTQVCFWAPKRLAGVAAAVHPTPPFLVLPPPPPPSSSSPRTRTRQMNRERQSGFMEEIESIHTVEDRHTLLVPSFLLRSVRAFTHSLSRTHTHSG